MPDDLIAIATFVTPAQAAAARCALEAQGVVSFLKDENVAGMSLGNAVGYVKLLVAAGDAERARALLETPFDDWPTHAEANDAEAHAFARQLANNNADAERQAANPYASPRSMIGPESPSEDESVPEEPGPRARCPSCGNPRVAACPFCRTVGGHFRAADDFSGAAPADEPQMLICPTCDEPFDAVYFRVCGACGHDFGSGLDAPPVLRDIPTEPLNWRVIAVGLAGVALVAGLMIYFAIILP